MTALLLALMLAQDVPCAGNASAFQQAVAFDLVGASERLQASLDGGCTSIAVHATYLRGLVAARDAYRFGGSPESLAPVRAAITQLKAMAAAADGRSIQAEIAGYVLEAAAAAAQSERDSMALLIEHAVQLEARRMLVDLPKAPIITAHEVAGDLWLQVHRYDDARRAYTRAARSVGPTPRVILGLARVAQRLKDEAEACRQYRALIASWKASSEPPEIVEARAAVRAPACQVDATRP